MFEFSKFEILYFDNEKKSLYINGHIHNHIKTTEASWN